MKSVVLIIPYFGKLPSYFNIWLMSAGHNPTIDFCIITDAVWEERLPGNVRLISMGWEENCRRVKEICGQDIVLHEPYKMCDYRPAYGEIYSDWTKGYDYWGHCDFDLVFGDIRAFLTEDILGNYDRVFTRGHFCLYKNQKDINSLYRKTVDCPGINCRDAFHTKYSCHFDEASVIEAVFADNGRVTYDKVCYADILYKHYPFRLAQDITGKDSPQIYTWKNGKLYRFRVEAGELLRDEFMYVHLQKRKMEISVKDPAAGLLIVPNKFCEEREVTVEYIEENSRESCRYLGHYYKLRMSNIWKNIRNGALTFRLNGKIRGR